MTAEGDVVYVLDTNVFVEAYRRYYAMEICPGFWDCLAAKCIEPKVVSIDRVREEIREGDDLERWVRGAAEEMFDSTGSQQVVDAFSEIMTWVNQNPQFFEEAKAEFARGADGWVVAYARVLGMAVVTQEVLRPDVRRKVPIPNVCNEFDVPSVDTFEMLRKLEVRFGWVNP